MSDFKFCSKCAGSLKRKRLRGHSRLTCPKCGSVFFQNPKPTVGVFIVEKGKVLLAKRAFAPFKGWWDSIGGFMEEGESPQSTAIRESKEETGLDVELTELLGTTKDYYDKQYIVPISFVAKIKSGKMKPDDDVSELKWFSVDSLPKNIAFDCNLEALKLLRKRLFLKG